MVGVQIVYHTGLPRQALPHCNPLPAEVVVACDLPTVDILLVMRPHVNRGAETPYGRSGAAPLQPLFLFEPFR